MFISMRKLLEVITICTFLLLFETAWTYQETVVYILAFCQLYIDLEWLRGIILILYCVTTSQAYFQQTAIENPEDTQRQISLEMFRLLEKNSAVPKILEAQRSKFSELAHSNWERQCLSGNCEKDVSQTRPGAHLIFKRCRGTFHLNTFFMFVEEGSLLVPWSH